MDFLFDNPFIIVVLIGIISSFFKKNKEEKKQTTQRSPKPFVERTPKPKPEIFKQLEQEITKYLVPERQEVPTKQETAKKSIQSDYLEAKKQAEAKPPVLQEQNSEQVLLEVQGEQYQMESSPPLTVPRASFSVDKDRLADAVIWSEILGPPRAKRPHRSVKLR